MKLIKVDNVSCIIFDYNEKILSYFERNFTVVDKSKAFIYGTYNPDKVVIRKMFYINREKRYIICFSGLIRQIEKDNVFKTLFEGYRIEDNRLYLSNFLETKEDIKEYILNDKTLRNYQIDLVNKIVRGNYNNLIIEAPTGSGKTLISMALIKLIGLKCLYLTSSKSLIKKNFDYAIACGFNKNDLGITCSGYDIFDKPIQFSTVQSALKNDINNYQLLIIDEVHDAGSNTYQNILKQNNFVFKIGMSATPFTNEVQKLNLIKHFGDVITTKAIDELIEENFLVKPIIHMIKLDYDLAYKRSLDFILDYTKLERIAIEENEKRNNVICNIAYSEYKKGKKVIIMTHFLSHQKKIQEMFMRKYGIEIKALRGANTQRQREKEIEQFNNDTGYILLASQIFKQGIDIPKLDVLILADSYSSSYLTKQKLGRILRKTTDKQEAHLYDFIDNQHKTLYIEV